MQGLTKEYQRYYEVTAGRTIDSQDYPERWGDYDYFSKVVFKEDNQRSVLYREKNHHQEKILDIYEVPWVRKSH